MESITTEELHHIPFDINEVPKKSNLLAASPNGIVFIARKNDLVVFNSKDYAQSSSSFSATKAKPLADFSAFFTIPFPRSITWICVNSSGSLLLIAFDTSIQLLNVQQLSAQPSYGALGSPLEIPASEGTIQDLAWNPVDKHRFALVSSTGSVWMFSTNPLQHPHINPVGNLQNIMAHCLSWSPKGKQLALAVTGIASGASASNSGNTTSILQVDPDLKVKRIIPIGDLLKDRLKEFTNPRPVDILWTSSYCFLVGVEDSDLSKGIQLVFVAALAETRLNRLPDFTSVIDSHHRYHLRLIPNSASLVAVTWSWDADECFLLEVPSISTAANSPPPDSVPRLLKFLPLPTNGSPIAMDIGALIGAHDPIPVILGLLNNGVMFAFKVSPPESGVQPQSPISAVFAGFKLWCESAESPPQLPSDGSVNNLPSSHVTKSEGMPFGSTLSNLGTSLGSPFRKSTNQGSPGLTASATSDQPSGFLFGKPVVSDNVIVSAPNVFATGPMLGKSTNPDSQAPGTTLFGGTIAKTVNTAAPSGSILAGLLGNSGDAAKSQIQNSSSSTATTSMGVPSECNLGKSITSASVLASNAASSDAVAFGNSICGNSTHSGIPSSTPFISSSPKTEASEQTAPDVQTPATVTGRTHKEPPQLAQSIIDAANQFSKALKSQAENSASAWNHLHSVFDGHSTNARQSSGEDSARRSVWDIEQSLSNMDNFLRIIDEIMSQLGKATQISVNEQKASSDFLDKLNADFDVFNRRMCEKHREMMTAGLDPEAANMLSSLKRKSRAAESCLAELEDQVESLTAKLEANNERSNRLSARGRPSLQLSDVGNALDKIQATVATNACLIKHERSRLELISRMAGISLNDSSSSNKPTNTSQLSLGGSSISLDREQRDAMLYRVLCFGDVKSKGRETKRKTSPTTDQRIPVIKASSTISDVLASMRMMEEAKNKTPVQSTPKVLSMNKSVDKNVSVLTSSTTTNKSPSSKQLNSLGKQKNQEISKLLASAESVPPVTLNSGMTSSRPPLLNFSMSADDSVLQSTPPPTVPEKPQPKSEPKLESAPPSESSACTFLSPATVQIDTTSPGTPASTKSSMFVPSTSMTLTSPTRATTIPAPTTKVLGAPKGNSDVDNFKPLSPRLHSLPSVEESAPPTTVQSPAIAQAAVLPPSGNLFGSMAASSIPIPLPNSFGIPPPSSANEPSKNLFGVTSASTGSELTKSIFGTQSTSPSSDTAKLPSTTTTASVSVSGSGQSPPSIPTNAKSTSGPAKSVFDILTTSSSNEPSKTLVFGSSPASASVSEPTKLLFGTQPPSTTSEPTKPPFETPVTTTSAATTQPVPTFGTPTATATTTAATPSTASASSKTPSLFGDATASTVPANSQPTSLFGNTVNITTPTFPTQSSQAFGQPQTTTSQSAQSSRPFGQSGVSASVNLFDKPPAPPSGLFGQSPTTTAVTPPSGLFGQPTATTTTAAAGSLFGQTSATSKGLFGQASSTAPASQSASVFGQPPAVPNSPQSSGLFGQSSATQQAGSLFGQPTQTFGLFGSSTANTQATGGLFGQPSQAPASPSGGGLFGHSPPPAASPTAGGLFGQSTGGGLFGQSSSGGLFGQSSTSTGGTTGGGLFGQVQPSQASQPQGGLFGSASNSASSGGLFGGLKPADGTSKPISGGLFGSSSIAPATTTVATTSSAALHSISNVSNLFAMSNFGLGSNPTTNGGSSSSIFAKPEPSSTGQTQGLFGFSSANVDTSSTTNKPGGLFGTPTLGTVSTPGSGGGLFGSSSATTNPPGGGGGSLFGGSSSSGGGGLFGSTAGSTGGSLFGTTPTFGSSSNQATSPTSNSSGGGLFSSSTGGGLFGSSGNTATGSLFGAAPSFGAPAVFGAGATLGAGSMSQPGSATTTAGAGGLFASLGSTAGGPTFGGLATSPQTPPTPLFGSSPSFTQRRA
nr:nuclear pore complex protein nup214 [Hymenolepis microstoma]